MPQLRTNEAQLFELSEPAARLSATLQNTLDDTAGDAPVPVPLGAASLARVAALLEGTVAVVEGAPEERRSELRKQGLPRGAALDDELRAATEAALEALGVASLLDVAQLLRELRWFDAPLPTTMLAERAARLLRGEPAAALREVLGVASKEHLSADEMSAVLAEPLCAPAAAAAAPAAAPATGATSTAESPAPPPPAHSVSLAMDDSDPFEGNTMACLERCDARTLRELKAVSAAWQRRAREVLCDAASTWRQQPIWSPSEEGRALAARLGSGSTEERREALRRMCAELDCGVDLPGHAWTVVPLLEDSEWKVRTDALLTLGKLDVAALAQYGAAVVARLLDSHTVVRKAARQGLTKLGAKATLAQHEAVISAKLEDSDEGMRRAAVRTLGELEPTALAQHAAALVARLEDSDKWVRAATAEVLGKLEVTTLAQHAAAVVARLEDSDGFPDEFVRRAAVQTLGKLEPAALAQYAAALVARLEDSDMSVREAAVQTIGELEPAVLAQYEQGIAKTAEEEASLVQHAAAGLLTKLRAGR